MLRILDLAREWDSESILSSPTPLVDPHLEAYTQTLDPGHGKPPVLELRIGFGGFPKLGVPFWGSQ